MPSSYRLLIDGVIQPALILRSGAERRAPLRFWQDDIKGTLSVRMDAETGVPRLEWDER